MIEEWHAIPKNDLREHLTTSANCKCKPVVTKHKNGNSMVKHIAWDAREFDDSRKGEPCWQLSVNVDGVHIAKDA